MRRRVAVVRGSASARIGKVPFVQPAQFEAEMNPEPHIDLNRGVSAWADSVDQAWPEVFLDKVLSELTFAMNSGRTLDLSELRQRAQVPAASFNALFPDPAVLQIAVAQRSLQNWTVSTLARYSGVFASENRIKAVADGLRLESIRRTQQEAVGLAATDNNSPVLRHLRDSAREILVEHLAHLMHRFLRANARLTTAKAESLVLIEELFFERWHAARDTAILDELGHIISCLLFSHAEAEAPSRPGHNPHDVAQTSSGCGGTVEQGGYKLDPFSCRASLHGHELPLSPGEFDLAYLLFTNIGKTIEKAAIHRTLNSTGKSRNIDTAICRLRKKLMLDTQDSVRLSSVRRKGYRLECELITAPPN